MVSHIEAGRTPLRLDRAAVAARELGVSLDYLTGLTDEPMPSAQLAARVSELEDTAALAPTDDQERRGRLLPFARPGIRYVPFVQGVGLAAGASAAADDEYLLSYVPFRDDWLRRHGLIAEHCRVIEVAGDSMEPTIENGAVILVDFQRTSRRRDKVFAVRTEDGPVVKRLRRHDEDGWWLVSDNEDYTPRPWPRDAGVLGQVMWTGRTL